MFLAHAFVPPHDPNAAPLPRSPPPAPRPSLLQRCDTLEPPSAYSGRGLFSAYEDYIPEEMINRRLQHVEERREEKEEEPASANGTEKRKLSKWKTEKSYKDLKKWQGDADDGVEPKWKTQQKWKGDPENGILPKWQVDEKWRTKR